MTNNTPRAALALRVKELIQAKPGQKAKYIAAQLGMDRSEVNSVLYDTLRDQIIQDKSYRWWPKGTSGVEKREPEKPQKLDTKLARICRYYLDCLNHDDQGGLSVFASSRFDLDYVELDKLPLLSESPEDVFGAEAVRKLLNKTRQDRSRLMLVLGYPVRLAKIRGKNGWEGFVVEPILLFPFQEDQTNRHATPTFSDELPQINFKAIRSLSSADGASIVEEVVQLAEELGLATAESEIPDLDEIIPRLRSVRPEWEWREEPAPYNLVRSPQLSEISEPGIYNRAVLLVAERSPFTKGLESELALLQSVPENMYHDTAIGDWLRSEHIKTQAAEQQPLLEVLPINSEQRQAVLQGLTNPLTVITGPPGTGKSQVVTSLLLNAAYQGKKVLFASKNNKAVDVVEIRVNGLGPRPVLLRLGASEHQAKLAEYLLSLLALQASPEDEQQYRELLAVHEKLRKRFEQLDAELTQTVSLRNEIDQLEQQIETIRIEVGGETFRSFKSLDQRALRDATAAFRMAVHRADRSMQPLLLRLIWGLFKENRYRNLTEASDQFRSIALQLGLGLPAELPSDVTIGHWTGFAGMADRRFGAVCKVQEYFKCLDRLTLSKSIEQMSQEHCALVNELADTSESLWQAWLRLQPKRMSQDDRRLLREYGALLQLIVAGNESGERLGSQVFAKYHRLFPQITNVLSCWAVTSLSARGRVPFEPGFFDLLVIDEASQCDIASALPLLYRAKQAVIIGDPKQLRHISALPPKQDRQLLAKHELVEHNAGWAYSVTSLFDLASGLCRSEDIIALRDHHRSHADIIEFSNNHFYEGRLRVATRYDLLCRPEKEGPAVRWVDIKGRAIRPALGGAVNQEEARAVLQEIERLVLHQNYTGSLGVVSPFRAQANLIRDLVHQRPALIEKLVAMDFLSDTVHRFQGDEREVMIFSPVVSKQTPEGAISFLRNTPNLFNVAITRARSALVVVGDRQAALNSGIGYLSSFAEYVGQLGQQGTKAVESARDYGPEYPTVSRPELVSDWEKILYRALFAAGLRPIPQYDEDKYILDFALLVDHRKLNIEVDGERYHRNWDGELIRRDLIRNKRLIELGWDVVRFWVYQVRDDLQGCIARVRAWRDAGSA